MYKKSELIKMVPLFTKFSRLLSYPDSTKGVKPSLPVQ